MMRLPWFDFRAPRSVAEAARILAGEGPDASLIAGGTDLLPNMKRRQMAPKVLVSLRHVPELKRNGSVLGAGMTLTEIVRKPELPRGLRQAAAQVATVHLRNMGTIGGNLCLDTRCNYYNQNYEWRKAIDFCLKKDGDICWVATASKRCVAMSSTDCAPALLVLSTKVKLVSASGEREAALDELYNNDGIDYLRRRPDEILTEVRFENVPSTYWKLRRRGAVDFPVLRAAGAARRRHARDAPAHRALSAGLESAFHRGGGDHETVRFRCGCVRRCGGGLRADAHPGHGLGDVGGRRQGPREFQPLGRRQLARRRRRDRCRQRQ